jgi:4-amino-4-deoxy-L-arabinose transferase-like glycosyltransferase
MEGNTTSGSDTSSTVPLYDPRRLLRRDVLLLTTFCLLLFGYQMFDGRPLSLHEARLPETSREMYQHLWGTPWSVRFDHLLFPTSGERPWLERPPLPHWIVVGTSLLTGQACDKVWVVRLPSVLMGLSVVLMTAWIASVWFGRNIGLLSGLVLATMYEFYAYSILAEDDIFLAAIVTLAIALFVWTEFGSTNPPPDLSPRVPGEGAKLLNPIGNRPLAVWAFFVVLGLSNIVKSPLLGPMFVLAPTGAFLLWNWDWSRIRRYLWVWGAIIFVVLWKWWVLWAQHRFPDVARNWSYDYDQTHQYDEPFWYYPVVLGGLCMPWIVAAIPGFLVTGPQALRQKGSGARFLWCWAIMPVIVFSIPHRKHHHYLVPGIAPWAILAAVGLAVMWRDLTKSKPNVKLGLLKPIIAGCVAAVIGSIAAAIFGPKSPVPIWQIAVLVAIISVCVGCFFAGLSARNGKLAGGACFVGIALAYCWGQSCLPDLVANDTAFLQRTEKEVPADQRLFVNSDLAGEMDFFRNLFYLRPTATLLHNLTYLRDDQIADKDAWIVTRHRDLEKLQTLGEVTVADESAKSRRERSAEDRFTLFHLVFKPDLRRYPRPPYINTLQAMGREPGPYCGPGPL